jgi:hypothetical protein
MNSDPVGGLEPDQVCQRKQEQYVLMFYFTYGETR